MRQGVRTFEPVTPSPCILLLAARPRPPLLGSAALAAAATALAAALALALWARRRP